MKREKIIETLKSNFFHYDGKGEWKLRNWNFDDSADQLLSEEMGDRMALVYFEVALVEFAKFVWAHEEDHDILTGYNKDGVIETIGFTIHGRSQSDFRFSDKVIELLSKLSHPKPVDEPKQVRDEDVMDILKSYCEDGVIAEMKFNSVRNDLLNCAIELQPKQSAEELIGFWDFLIIKNKATYQTAEMMRILIEDFNQFTSNKTPE